MQELTSKLHDKLGDYIEDALALEEGVVDQPRLDGRHDRRSRS